MSPYLEGREAYFSMQEISANPHPKDSEAFQDWVAGWKDEQEHHTNVIYS